MKGLENFKKHR